MHIGWHCRVAHKFFSMFRPRYQSGTIYWLCMSEHVILNPVPTPEQMADLLGVSHDRVEALRRVMRSASPSSSAPLAKSRKSVTQEKAIATKNSRTGEKNQSRAKTTR
jgi:hypothetical protein